MTTLDNANNLSPSTAPEKPRADSLGIVRQLDRLTQVGEGELLNAEEIAKAIFEFLSDIPDEDVLNGRIRTNDPNLKPYAAALNRLFLLVKNSETGAIRQLTAGMVESISPKAYAMSAVNGGRQFVEIMCDVVNSEFEARTPASTVAKINNARPAFRDNLAQNNSEDPTTQREVR